MDILEKVVLIELMVSAWSGSARLTRADLDIEDGKLPPADIATVGSIKLIDQSETKTFGTLKRAAERAVQKVGIPFMRGYVVSVDLVPSLALELDKLKEKYELAAKSLVGDYRGKVENFVNNHPDWAEVMKKKCPSEQYLNNQLKFEWLAAQVVPPDERFSRSIRAGFERETGDLGNRLMYEVAAEATEFWDKCVEGRTEPMTHKTVGALRGIQMKLESLSFLNSHAAPVAARVRDVLDSLPRTGPLNPDETRAVTEVVQLLQNPTKVVRAAAIEAKVEQSALDLKMGQPASAPRLQPAQTTVIAKKPSPKVPELSESMPTPQPSPAAAEVISWM